MLAATAATVTASFLFTQFMMTRWYRADATLRPASQEGPTYNGGILGVTGLSSVASSIGSSLGIGSSAWDAEEEMAILTSYGFTMSVIDRLHLADRILPRKARPSSSVVERFKILFRSIEVAMGFDPYARWKLYDRMGDLFNVSYDDKLGNMDVSFLDPDPRMATKVLQFYIDSLRELLRLRAVSVASAAIKSMEDQAMSTSDSLLLAQLDQLIAMQMQAEATAQVQSDFAFVVVQPAYVPAVRDQPWTLIDCAIVALLTPGFFILGLLLNDRVIKPYRESQLLTFA